jgi:hypothetical protein
VSSGVRVKTGSNGVRHRAEQWCPTPRGVEFFSSRKQAEDALRQVLADEPDFEGALEVVEVDLSGAT